MQTAWVLDNSKHKHNTTINELQKLLSTTAAAAAATTTTTTTTTILPPPPCTLSKTVRVSWYQKGKTNLDLLEQETQWVAVASAGPYADMHLAPDR